MNIKVVIHRTKQKDQINITDMVKSVTWSGDVNSLPRTLSVELINTNDVNTGKMLLTYNVGNMVVFYKDNTELFRGFIFKRTMSTDGNETFTAYDELIYATKNTETILVKNKAASDVITSLFKKYGIAIGSIEATGHKVAKLALQEKSLADIADELLRETGKHNNKTYKIYSSKGKVYMKSRGKADQVVISAGDIISGSNEISIEETRTQVKVTKGSLEVDPKDKKAVKLTSTTVKDSSTATSFGIMQHIENVDDKTTMAAMKKKAQSILNKMKQSDQTISVELMGNHICTTGKKFNLSNELAAIVGTYYITGDSHTFDSGVHKMTLQLSKRLE